MKVNKKTSNKRRGNETYKDHIDRSNAARCPLKSYPLNHGSAQRRSNKAAEYIR